MASVLSDPIKGLVGRDGSLLSADPPLMRLHLEAGGREGGALALPQAAAAWWRRALAAVSRGGGVGVG